jgi:DNA-binding MarR family transcriptional regulator
MRAKDGPRGPAAELVACLDAALRRSLRHERSARADKVQLTRMEFRLISELGRRGNGSMGELAADLALAESSLNAVADRLVRKRLLARQRSEADRRVVRVALTPAGRRFFAAALRVRLRMAEGMLGALDAREQAVFLGLFRKISGGAAPVTKLRAKGGEREA